MTLSQNLEQSIAGRAGRKKQPLFLIVMAMSSVLKEEEVNGKGNNRN